MNLPELHVIATTPAQMEVAQKELVDWCDARIAYERGELWTATENYEIARKAKWRARPWQTQCRKHRNQITYYEKIKAAVTEGYYIVPPFPVDIFAIRTGKAAPKPDYHVGHSSPAFVQAPQILPQGRGEYVSDRPEITSLQIVKKDGTRTAEHWPEELRPVDFPMTLVRPEVIDATQKAMAAKIFDQMGILPSRRGRRPADPIVVGQILNPAKRDKPVTFFVAWWLNTDDL